MLMTPMVILNDSHQEILTHEYSIDHFEDKFYIITNWKAKNNRLMQTPDSKTDIANWEEVLPIVKRHIY